MRDRVSQESVDRMLAFAALLAALENKDKGKEVEARGKLRALGIAVSVSKGGAR